MKICFLAHAASIHTRRWMHYFRDRGHQVSIITLTPAEPEQQIEVYDLQHQWTVSYNRSNWHYLLHLLKLWKIVREIQPDIVNAHFLSSYGFLGALVRPTDCPFVVSLHGSDILVIPKRSFIHRWAARFALNRTDLVTSVAEHMTGALTEYVTPDKPVLTLQYGIDIDKFYPPSKLTTRASICFSNRTLVSVSNVETILLAAHKLQKRGSSLHIVLAGGGELFKPLLKKTKSLNLECQVSFMGRIEHTLMPSILRSVSIYISMSFSDGTSLSLLEAMACGAFPVVSDIPANREWITDGVNGYLVPVDDPEMLAQKLDEAWVRAELRCKAAKYNWSLIQEKGDYQKNMGIIEAAFQRLVEQRS